MTVKGSYVAVGAVALLLIGGWVGSFYKDHAVRQNESLLKAQAVELQSQLEVAKASTTAARAKAAEAEVARCAAVETARASALKADIAYASYMESRSVSTYTNTPEPLDAFPVVAYEHSARLDCTQALSAASQEIGALKEVASGLTEEVRLATKRADMSDATLDVVTDDRDTQLKRKKVWRGIACALGAIGTAALLF